VGTGTVEAAVGGIDVTVEWTSAALGAGVTAGAQAESNTHTNNKIDTSNLRVLIFLLCRFLLNRCLPIGVG
jgi:hypothetical protein